MYGRHKAYVLRSMLCYDLLFAGGLVHYFRNSQRWIFVKISSPVGVRWSVMYIIMSKTVHFVMDDVVSEWLRNSCALTSNNNHNERHFCVIMLFFWRRPLFSGPAFSVYAVKFPERFPLQSRSVMFSVIRSRNWCLVRVTVTELGARQEATKKLD